MEHTKTASAIASKRLKGDLFQNPLHKRGEGKEKKLKHVTGKPYLTFLCKNLQFM